MASKCYLLITPITLLLRIPTVRAIAVHWSTTIDGGREERPPPPKRDGWGICRAVVRSPAVAIAHHARARPPPLGPHMGPSHQPDAAAPPRRCGRRRHAIVVERRRLFCRSNLRNKERAGDVPPLPSRALTMTIGAASGRATTRRRAGGRQRSARIGAVGRQRWLAVVRACGGRRDERLKTAGGGG